MGEVLTIDAAVQWRQAAADRGETVVFTNGHFDLLHVGHLDYLEKARALGDALIVGLNDDESTRLLKGPGRPLVSAAERARLLAALVPVAGVVVFSGPTAIPVIEQLKPDIYAKGGDYAHKHLPERETVEALGGEVRLIDYLPDHSTTDLIVRVKALPEDA